LVDEIQQAVASYYGLALAQLTSSSRAAGVAWPRQVAIHLARVRTDASLQAIGKAFGGRNHATVLHACKRVAERMNVDHQAVHEIEELTHIIDRSRCDRSS
jgi:chromosomal replication initiator protein